MNWHSSTREVARQSPWLESSMLVRKTIWWKLLSILWPTDWTRTLLLTLNRRWRTTQSRSTLFSIMPLWTSDPPSNPSTGWYRTGNGKCNCWGQASWQKSKTSRNSSCLGCSNVNYVTLAATENNRFLITGCAVVQHCCNDDQQSQWENRDFDPQYIWNPWKFYYRNCVNIKRWFCKLRAF